MRGRVDFTTGILMWFVALCLGVFLAGCAATFVERAPTLGCDEACECVAHKLHNMRQWSSYEGADKCNCWYMDTDGNHWQVTTPRRPPLGYCE